jgi:hypothetical protein
LHPGPLSVRDARKPGIYLLDGDRKTARLAGSTGWEEGSAARPEVIGLAPPNGQPACRPLEDDILHLTDNASTGRFFGIEPERLSRCRASELGVLPPEPLPLEADPVRLARVVGNY